MTGPPFRTPLLRAEGVADAQNMGAYLKHKSVNTGFPVLLCTNVTFVATPLHKKRGSRVDAESLLIAESGTLTMPNLVWDRTKSISSVIAPLASQAIVGI